MSSLQEYVNAQAEAERRACIQEFDYRPEAASENMTEHEQNTHISPQAQESHGDPECSTTTGNASRSAVSAASSTSTIHDKDRRMGLGKAPIVKHRSLKAK